MIALVVLSQRDSAREKQKECAHQCLHQAFPGSRRHCRMTYVPPSRWGAARFHKLESLFEIGRFKYLPSGVFWTGYLGQFSFPGGVPQCVTKGGTPLIYDNERDAEADAAIACIKACNARYTFRVQTTDPNDTGVRSLSNATQEVYTKLTGPEFAVLVAEANITPNYFCFLNAIPQERFFQQVDGAKSKDNRHYEVPHHVRVLLEIFKRIPQAIDIAEEVTEKVTKQRKPRREG